MLKVATLIQSTLKTKIKTSNKREVIIATTVLAGMLIPLFIFLNNNQFSRDLAYAIDIFYPSHNTLYYTHLFLNFTKSFFMLLLCSHAILITESKRLKYIITPLVAASMAMDLLSMLSIDMYFFIKPFRTESPCNFKDIYFAFEVGCLLFTLVNYTLDYIQSTISNYSNRHDALCDSFVSKNFHKKA